MGEKIVINPLTRISGFLEIEAIIENHKIVDAKSSGMLFRGFEKMLQGRSPLDATYFTERICGICSAAHSIVSTTAVEDALKVVPNVNDSMVREIIHGCEFLQNHLRHFYQFTFPDYVRGSKINPAYEERGGDYRLPESLDKKLSENYVESIRYSRDAHKALAILGGKAPHNHGVFVGGVTVSVDASKLIEIKSIISKVKSFIANVMITDVNIIAKYYSDYFYNGKGFGNLMSYGIFDNSFDEPFVYVRPQVLIGGKRYALNEKHITEGVYNSWYEGNRENIRPEEEYIETNVYKENAYTFIKAPRYAGFPVEVGPLARMYLSGGYTRGISTMDRTIARVLEADKVCDIILNLLDKLKMEPTNQTQHQIPDKAQGMGLRDTTRGALGHWIAIEDKKIKNYSIITPTVWNLSPTDSRGIKGVVEKALIGTHIEDSKNPVEIGRIVRTFDPCVSCATHVISNNNPDITIKIV